MSNAEIMFLIEELEHIRNGYLHAAIECKAKKYFEHGRDLKNAIDVLHDFMKEMEME